MSIRSAFAQYQTRGMQFMTFRAALNFHKLPTSRSWVSAEQKITDAATTPLKVKEDTALLNRIFQDNIRYGNKAVQITRFDNVAAPLFTTLKQAVFTPTYKPASFELGITNAVDLNLLSMTPELVFVEPSSKEGCFTLFFYARSYITEKEQFLIDDMKDELSQQRFAGFDQIIAYRRIAYVRIDTIFIDQNDLRVEFRVDITRLDSLDRMQEALKALKEAFRTYLVQNANSKWADVVFPLINLYPKIPSVYADKKGTVVRLGHHTSTGAINQGKMRGLLGDLKQDPGHVAGMAAVVTESFSITKLFSYDSGYSSVRLSIPGRSADAGQPDARVVTAIIEDCHREEQFEDMASILR